MNLDRNIEVVNERISFEAVNKTASHLCADAHTHTRTYLQLPDTKFTLIDDFWIGTLYEHKQHGTAKHAFIQFNDEWQKIMMTIISIILRYSPEWTELT